jgi:hypothetical protein
VVFEFRLGEHAGRLEFAEFRHVGNLSLYPRRTTALAAEYRTDSLRSHESLETSPRSPPNCGLLTSARP